MQVDHVIIVLDKRERNGEWTNSYFSLLPTESKSLRSLFSQNVHMWVKRCLEDHTKGSSGNRTIVGLVKLVGLMTILLLRCTFIFPLCTEFGSDGSKEEYESPRKTKSAQAYNRIHRLMHLKGCGGSPQSSTLNNLRNVQGALDIPISGRTVQWWLPENRLYTCQPTMIDANSQTWKIEMVSGQPLQSLNCTV